MKGGWMDGCGTWNRTLVEGATLRKEDLFEGQ